MASKTTLALLILLSLLFSTSALASISIPEETYEYVSEKEIIDIFCYEARWKGGEGVARLEALSEVLGPALDEVIKAGIAIDRIDLGMRAREMRQRLEEICRAESVNQATQLVQDYKLFAQGIREELQGQLAVNLRNLESDFRRKGEELKTRLESELNQEAQRLAQEAEGRLRRQGESMGRELESQFRSLAQDFKTIVIPQGEDISPSEVIATAERIANKFSIQDQSVKSFLSNKFSDILNEARALSNLAGEGGLSPEQAQSRAEGRVSGVVAEIKNFLTDYYQDLGRQEEAKIRERLEEKANQIAGEEKDRLESIRDVFDNIEARIDTSFQAKIGEWQTYEQRSTEKKAAMIKRIISAKFDQARQMIEANKDKIEAAIEGGVAEEYGIMSYDQLMAEIEQDEQEISAELDSGEISGADISLLKARFQQKWNAYRNKMEAISFPGPEKVIEEILNRYSLRFWEQRLRQIEGEIRKQGDVIQGSEESYRSGLVRCAENQHYVANPSKAETYECLICISLDYLNDMREPRMVAYHDLQSNYEVMKRLVERLTAYSEYPPQSFAEAIAFKNEIQASGEIMESIYARHRALSAEASRAANGYLATCRNLAK